MKSPAYLLYLSVVLCFIGLTCAPAHAQRSGPYIAIMAGGTLLLDTEFEGNGVPSDNRVSTSWDTGFYIGAAAGYRTLTGLRLELELTYRRNELDRLEATAPGFAFVSRKGRMESAVFLGNVWYDFGAGDWSLMPYLGGGVGIGGIELELEPVPLPASGTFLTDEWETAAVFAFQLGAGLTYPVTDSFTTSLDYRFLGTSDPEFAFRAASAEYLTHNFGVSFRYEF